MTVHQQPYSRTFDVLGVPLSTLQLESAVRTVISRAADRVGTVVNLCSTDTIRAASVDLRVRNALSGGALNLVDGTPLIWLGKRSGTKHPVRGADFMRQVLIEGKSLELRHFMLGSTENTLSCLVSQVRGTWGSNIVGTYAPPHTDLESLKEEIVRRIIDSEAHVVWVAVGTPRQNLWVDELAKVVPSTTFCAVGAAFDFLAKTKSEAPHWVRGSGFEWLFRLIREPARLWRRYLIQGPEFLWVYLRNRRKGQY